MKYKNLEKMFEEKQVFDSIRCIRTGIDSLDNIVGNLKPGTITIVGGRIGMGKTSFVLDICHYNAAKFNIPVAYFMKNNYCKSILERLINFEIKCEAGTNGVNSLRDGAAANTNTINKLEQRPMFVSSYYGWGVNDILEECYKMRIHLGVNLVVIEDINSFYENNKKVDAALIYCELKSIARELNIPIIVTTNLISKVENRRNHIPQVTDIPSIKQISGFEENIILLYRDGYYNPKAGNKSIALVYCKNGYRKPCIVKLEWDDINYNFIEAELSITS